MEETSFEKNDVLKVRHLGVGIFTGAIILCLILSFFHVSSESVAMLTIFDFLFISLIFPLSGKLVKKTILLLVGNIIGLLWNNIFSLFAHATVDYFGEFFNVWYVILNPLLNLVWIVSLWSISLSFLTEPRNREGSVKT